MNLAPDGPHLLDTSAVILLMRHGVTATSEAVAPFVTLAELLTGAARARDMFREREKIYTALGFAAIVYPDLETLSIYGRASAQLQRAGFPIPTNAPGLPLWRCSTICHCSPLTCISRACRA